MKKILFILLPFVTFLLTIEMMFLDIQLQKPFDPYKFSLEEGSTTLKEEKNTPIPMQIGKGIFQKIYFFSELHRTLKDTSAPSDGKVEKTISKIERVILSLKIAFFINLFLAAVSICAFISMNLEAYFSPFLNRFQAISSIFVFMPYLSESSRLIETKPSLGILGVLFFLGSSVYAIWIFRKFGKLKKQDNFTYQALYHASKSEEENLTKQENDPISLITFAFHFSVIIFSGILIGNFLYIPLFSLQKNFSAQFGILLIVLFFGLSLFYVKNYYTIGKEIGYSKFQNILASVAFLQFRFIKNILFTVLSLTGVIFFITLLFSLLAFNSFILKSANFLLQTQASL